jgi:GDP-L-fucose synthase
MQNFNEPGFLNIGTGVDITISDVAQLIANIVGFEGTIINDTTKPDGTPRKLMDVAKINALGWRYTIDLKEGLKSVVDSVQTLI